MNTTHSQHTVVFCGILSHFSLNMSIKGNTNKLTQKEFFINIGSIFNVNDFANTFNSQCKIKLEERQELIAEDVKADKAFYEACRKDIKENSCAKKRDIEAAPGDLEEDLRRVDVLLCLENAENNGENFSNNEN